MRPPWRRHHVTRWPPSSINLFRAGRIVGEDQLRGHQLSGRPPATRLGRAGPLPHSQSPCRRPDLIDVLLSARACPRPTSLIGRRGVASNCSGQGIPPGFQRRGDTKWGRLSRPIRRGIPGDSAVLWTCRSDTPSTVPSNVAVRRTHDPICWSFGSGVAGSIVAAGDGRVWNDGAVPEFRLGLRRGAERDGC